MTRFRARTVSTRFYPDKRPARSMVYHYGFACAAPWSFSSHLEQVPLFFYPPQPPPSSSLTAQACACAHAYTARRIFFLFLFLFLLLFFFNGRSRRIDLTSTRRIQPRYQTPSDRASSFCTAIEERATVSHFYFC